MLQPGFDASNFLTHHLNEYSPSHITRSGASQKTLKGTKNIEISCERDTGNGMRNEFHQAGRRHSPLCNTLIIKNQLF